MKTGLQATCQVLATTRNRAVLPLLQAGMRAKNAEVRADVLRAAVHRRDHDTKLQLINAFGKLTASDQQVVCDAHRQIPQNAAVALQNAVLGGDENQCANALEIILGSSDFNQFSTLITAAEKRHHRQLSAVLATFVALVDELFEAVARWSAGDNHEGHDPAFVRYQLLAALEKSLTRFDEHQRKEFLDAFMLFAPANHPTVGKILRDQRHACHDPLVASLKQSDDSGIMQRLVDMLRETDAPDAALKIISQRTDQHFVNILLHEVRHPVPLRVLHNMQRMKHVAWLESHRELLLEVDGRAQAVAVELAAASRIDRGALFALLAFLLRNGLAEGRRASCQALRQFNDEQANGLILSAINDPDPAVKAAAIPQLRSRHLRDAANRLVEFLDSPALEVREAARGALAEFNYVRFRSMFDLLDEGAARATGRIVAKVDQSATQKLSDDLNSPALATRLRALEMAVAMALAEEVEPQLIELARHENMSVRKEAILALGHCSQPEVDSVLAQAIHDEVAGIAEAARASLVRRRQQPAAMVRDSTK